MSIVLQVSNDIISVGMQNRTVLMQIFLVNLCAIRSLSRESCLQALISLEFIKTIVIKVRRRIWMSEDVEIL
jgi:hypothetical protein